MNARIPIPPASSVDDLAGLIETLHASAPERDRKGGHAAQEKALIRTHGLLLDAVPRAFGGRGRSWSDVFATVRRIAAVDSALAHVLAFHHLQVATVLIYGSEEQQARWLTATVREQGWWGNGMNPLDKRLQARAVEDGFVLDGTKSFCSGTSGSSYMTFSAEQAGTGGAMLLGIVPTQQAGIVVLDDWDPIGQRQTDSNSVAFSDVALPARDVIRAADAVPTPFHTLRTCIGQLVLVNLYLGIAIGAQREARHHARTSARPWVSSGVAHATDDPFMLNRFGELRVQVAASNALADRAAHALDAAFAQGHSLSALERAEVSVATAEAKVVAHRAGLYASQELFEVVGARGTRSVLGFDRFWRNVRTHTLHDPLDYKLNMLGRWALKDEAPPPSLYN
ncbi:acyl-CoA dehydrogenase family protein [Variovorax sp. J22R115]|uniref:acyl-CoA dehydrogenase family protein n=1 Tax=Variovorax sp. J22R115 TaxID=3053509 RepID=UPI0025784CBB|nr:acyl-CoA dehydrogenase family protein [Variovorax sp. J22R115]MDM0047698.1 acyl-CoA dehydrogenase family protein [Variovorax sp. J22R115]